MRFNIFNRRTRIAMCSLMLCCLIINPSCDSTQNTLINIRNKDQLDTILNQYVDEGYFPFLFARLEDKNGRVLYEHCRINRNLIPKEVINGQTWITSELILLGENYKWKKNLTNPSFHRRWMTSIFWTMVFRTVLTLSTRGFATKHLSGRTH